MNKPLFSDSDNEIEEIELKTNQGFANSYNQRRKNELLQKYKDHNAFLSESDNESESSEEDEAIDPKFDQNFFRTLASLKGKDPSIYNSTTRFFNNEDCEEDDGKKSTKEINKKKKPLTIIDYERKLILERNGITEDPDEENRDEQKFRSSPTIVESERILKEEIKKVITANDENHDEDSDDGLLQKRPKTTDEIQKEEADHVAWLAGKTDQILENAKETLEPLKNYWNNKNLPAAEQFLRDYILNKGYANTNESKIPKYEDIVIGIGEEGAQLSEDEKELEKQAEFEQKYNFRFEEPDPEFIKRYPRTIESSLRQANEKRKQKRQETKERKEQEKQQKMKEIEIVRQMKKTEIQEKIEKLKTVTGNDELPFKDEDLDGDFDPEKHDRLMQETFNENYYQEGDEEKPECPSDIDDLKIEDWDHYDPKTNSGRDYDDYEPHCEDEDFNMDCEYDPETKKRRLQEELIDSTRKKRKGRRNHFVEMLQAEKPPFNPDDEKTWGEYIDEYYKLDCEDIIGGLPCRFKYVETAPNDFGLTIEEIILAKNKELNQWCSLKKTVQIRPAHVDKREQFLYRKRAENVDLKRKIFHSIYGEGSDSEDEVLKKEEVPKHTEQSATSIAKTPLTKSKKRRLRKAKLQASVVSTSTETKSNDCGVSAFDKMNTSCTGEQEGTAVKESKSMKRKKRKAKAILLVNSSAKLSTGEEMCAIKKMKPKIEKDVVEKETKPVTEEKLVLNGTMSVKNVTQETFSNKQNDLNERKAAKKFITNKANANKLGSTNRVRKQKASGKGLKHKFSKTAASKGTDNNSSGISDDRLKAYGINPRKFHKKQKYGGKQTLSAN